ncbi:MAG: hypothetical protein K2G90_01105 [Muribaculaceae bacterium]|nr:hypothetical protein [Muribaculaceae bacterium]
MKNLLLFFTILIALSGCRKSPADDSTILSQLYSNLDDEISKAGEYDKEKEQRIRILREDYVGNKDKGHIKEVLEELVHEFNSYNSDSALYYVNAYINLPGVKETPDLYTKLLIRRADIFAHAGLFPDALEILASIPRNSLSPELLEDYYSTYCATYQYLSEYASEHEAAPDYSVKRSLYADSLRMVTKQGSFNDMVYVMAEKARTGDPDTAIKELKKELLKYHPGLREYSIIASTLAYIYKTVGNDTEYKKNLVMSAISDVKGSVKENMSFREMATVMFEDGDVERANFYLKKSIADANFYSALMRNAQSSKMLPVIDEAYTLKQKQLTSRLRVMVWCSSILSCVLIVTVFYILKQFKSLRRANRKIKKANEELSEMSVKLKESNEALEESNEALGEKNDALARINAEFEKQNHELASKNQQLIDSNLTKEQYAGLFMEYCSSAISTLHSYQKSLKVLAAQGGNRSALIKKIESPAISEEMLKRFYQMFDQAIFKLYPDFIEKFNALLIPEERITLKSGELLTTELRLYALIRMGIDDSDKIANFLRCSISTVYTYRSKMKKRALRPDSFEEDVRQIW